jgi:hypothetical protein
MRYHWGLGIGHFHAHQPATPSSHIPEVVTQLPECEIEGLDDNSVDVQT